MTTGLVTLHLMAHAGAPSDPGSLTTQEGATIGVVSKARSAACR